MHTCRMRNLAYRLPSSQPTLFLK